MKKCYILRGVPGSGKSTLAKELAGSTGKIHNTDEYFMKDGQYVFDPSQLPRYHQLNFEAFKTDLISFVSPVVVDNTNTRKWEFEKYLKEAELAGYNVEVISIPHIDPELAAKRNTHGVPEEAIKRMIDRWEY